jgi:tetratricopeptide (TPR) repeat protein
MKKADKYKLIIACWLVTSLIGMQYVAASAVQHVDSLIVQGNSYYMNKDYDMAVRCYLEVIQRGYESGDLYYNLGNVYYKSDHIANAILYYEKALLLKPGDEDIMQNLMLANARIIDKIDTIPAFFIKRWIKYIQGLLSPNHWAVLCLILFFLSLAGFTLFAISNRIQLKKAGFTAGVILIIFTITGLAFMQTRIRQIQQHDNAIIMVSSVNARSSPDEQSTNVFVLHEGTKVMLTDSVQQWKEIRIANGNKGWIPREVLEEI